MLAPVAYHQAQPHDGEREDEHEGGRAGIDVVVEHVDGDVVADFPEGTFGGVLELPLPPEVQREFQPDEEDEAPDISEEVGDAIAVVVHRCAQIIPAIPLDVVVLDVVVEV